MLLLFYFIIAFLTALFLCLFAWQRGFLETLQVVLCCLIKTDVVSQVLCVLLNKSDSSHTTKDSMHNLSYYYQSQIGALLLPLPLPLLLLLLLVLLLLLLLRRLLLLLLFEAGNACTASFVVCSSIALTARTVLLKRLITFRRQRFVFNCTVAFSKIPIFC